jgi:excisionase family DNA binding protein
MSNVIPLRRSRPDASFGRLTYTVAELSDLLGLGLGLTYAALQNGEIPARKVGSRWVISKAAIHAWLDTTTHEDKEVS